MSETKRVLLNEDVLDDVTGGNVQYVCNSQNRFAWGSHNPSVKYGFTSKTKMLAFIRENYDLYGEVGIFKALCDEGICYPLPEGSTGT